MGELFQSALPPPSALNHRPPPPTPPPGPAGAMWPTGKVFSTTVGGQLRGSESRVLSITPPGEGRTCPPCPQPQRHAWY